MPEPQTETTHVRDKTCASCAYSHVPDKADRECRRYPPSMEGEMACWPDFPCVCGDYWCGEWSAKYERVIGAAAKVLEMGRKD